MEKEENKISWELAIPIYHSRDVECKTANSEILMVCQASSQPHNGPTDP